MKFPDFTPVTWRIFIFIAWLGMMVGITAGFKETAFFALMTVILVVGFFCVKDMKTENKTLKNALYVILFLVLIGVVASVIPIFEEFLLVIGIMFGGTVIAIILLFLTYG